MISVDPKERLTAKDTLTILKGISRQRIQNEYDSSEKHTLTNFKNLTDECQIHIFSFLEFIDILNLMVLNKDMNKKVDNENLWEFFCKNTHLGVSVIKCTGMK